MSWIVGNLTSFLLVLGFALLVTEVAVFGFSVFILFFVGLACLVTGAFVWIGILPASLTLACIAVALLSVVFAITLWEPLKRMQNTDNQHSPVNTDLIGQSFVLKQTLVPHHFVYHRLSGVNWKVKADSEIKSGTLVQVVKADVGELTVCAK